MLRLLCLLGAAIALPASAQPYPGKPVRIVVPTAPGGGYDLIGRLLGDGLQAELGQPFVVENRVGAGSLIGTQSVATAPPDGHTLIVGGLANMAFSVALYRNVRYDPVADFTPIAVVGAFSYTLIGRKDLALNSVAEIVAHARANPGKLSIASAGTGTGQQVAALMLNQFAKVNITEVPYKGAQPAYTDLLGGRIDLFFDNTTTALPFIESGRVKAFATSGSRRDALLPTVPTGVEAGVEGLTLDSWIGLFAPAKTPPAIIEKLRAALLKVMERPEVRKRLESSGWRIISMPPRETEAFFKSEAVKWPEFLRHAGIKPE
jgi:tripartite-type tricarboxylate transporter receptor subunit TctC